MVPAGSAHSISLSWTTDTSADCTVYYGSYAFYGPFYTGVLIADDVVLTAAHCLSVDVGYYGRVPSAAKVVFYL